MRVFFLLLLALAGCDMSSPQDVRDKLGQVMGIGGRRAAVPELGNATAFEDGISWHESWHAPTNGTMLRIWSALPRTEGQIPCLIWTPTSMAWKLGGRLGREDKEQMELFAKAGIGVVAFDVPGAWEDNATLDELGAELDRHMEALGGVKTGRSVLDFVLARIPQVDPDRIWAAGEGPAATLALLLAQADGRVRAVVAFDPVTDMAAYAQSEEMGFLFHLRPQLKDFLLARSPGTGLDRLRCPVLLYHDTFSHAGNFSSLEVFYMHCLRYQKDVAMVDTLDVDPVHAGLGLRTSRALAWFKKNGRRS